MRASDHSEIGSSSTVYSGCSGRISRSASYLAQCYAVRLPRNSDITGLFIGFLYVRYNQVLRYYIRLWPRCTQHLKEFDHESTTKLCDRANPLRANAVLQTANIDSPTSDRCCAVAEPCVLRLWTSSNIRNELPLFPIGISTQMSMTATLIRPIVASQAASPIPLFLLRLSRVNRVYRCRVPQSAWKLRLH